MDMKSLLGILVCCMNATLNMAGQNGTSLVSQINEIKKSGIYVYAEATMPEEDKAREGAMALLETGIENCMKNADMSQGVFDFSLFDSHVKLIKTKRGDQHRVFVYIDKSVLAGQDKKVPSSTQKEERLAVDVQVIDLTESVVETSNENTVNSSRFVYVLNDIEKKMLCVKRFDGIKSFIENLDTINRLNRYGKYVTLPRQGEFHMFIYSQSGDVVACLLKIDNEYYNLGTQSVDRIENYKKCGSIWLEIKK